MTQTNLSRPQGLNRIDPVLRKAAIDPGVVEFRAETLPVDRERAKFLAAQRAAAVDTDGVTVESRSIAGPDGQRLGLRLYRGPTGSESRPG
jgi:acetyl esterase